MNNMPEKKRLPAPIYGIDKKIRSQLDPTRYTPWNSYFIPGTDVMRNLLGSTKNSYGMTDAKKLGEIEDSISLANMEELIQNPIPGKFDLDHMRQIHKFILGDIYPWAGEIRTVNMAKMNVTYADISEIESTWKDVHEVLDEINYLKDMNKEDFIDNLAIAWGLINHAHAFREGNTRSQTAFFYQLAKEAGYELDISRLDPHHPQSLRKEFIDARFTFQVGSFEHKAEDPAPLAHVLDQITMSTQDYEKSLQPAQEPNHDPHKQQLLQKARNIIAPKTHTPSGLPMRHVNLEETDGIEFL